MNTAGLFPQSIHIPHTKKSDFTEAAFSPLVPITKVFGGGGGRRKAFFRKVPPPQYF